MIRMVYFLITIYILKLGERALPQFCAVEFYQPLSLT